MRHSGSHTQKTKIKHTKKKRERRQKGRNPTDIYQELAETEPEPCYGRKCTANEHCCPGSVCIDIEGVTGSCVFAYGLRQGELCRRDNDCESGLVCSEEVGEGRQCRPPSNSRKQYSCNTNSFHK
ncbi:hypothetical protein FOCC_FOCC002572 [Frankliniella occidentalis]|nr:hypothetical protein FOCC_FOCC002572 [Frankliniella occidentalis]